MRIGRRDQSLQFGTPYCAPILRESEKKLLQRHISAGGLLIQILPLRCGVSQKCHVGQAHPAVVRRILAQCEFAIDLRIAHAELAVFVHNATLVWFAFAPKLSPH